MTAANIRSFAVGVSWPLRLPRKANAPLIDCQKPIGLAMAWIAPRVEVSIWALPISSTWAAFGAAAKNWEKRVSWASFSGTPSGSGNRGFVDVKR